MKHMALDAIPDPGDTQVIVYSRWDRSPDIIEDQVTDPIVAAMWNRLAGVSEKPLIEAGDRPTRPGGDGKNPFRSGRDRRS